MSEPEEQSRHDHILDVVSDLVADFLYYDRKEDEDLERGEIEDAIASGEITVAEIVDQFREQLLDGLNPDDAKEE